MALHLREKKEDEIASSNVKHVYTNHHQFFEAHMTKFKVLGSDKNKPI